MSFPKDEGLDGAVEMLKSLKPREILAGDTKPDATSPRVARPDLILSLRGLLSMGKPEKATVFYAPLSGSGTALQSFAESIRAKFEEASLLVPRNRPLTLHATIVNTRHVKRVKRYWKPIFVKDAQALLDRYKRQVWAERVLVEKIAICRMNAKPVKENGIVVDAEYEVVAEIDL